MQVFFQKIKILARKLAKHLVYFALVMRLNILWLKHRISNPRMVSRKLIGKIPSSANLSIFSWKIGDDVVKTRLIIIVICFALGFLTLSFRLVQVSIGESAIKSISGKHKFDYRLDIVDRNGNLLAASVPSSSLFANPLKVIDPELSVKKLKQVFPDINEKKLLKGLKSGKHFIWVKRDLTPKQRQEIFNLGMPGFEFESESKRIYPYGNLLSHVIGYVGRDMVGLAGIEKYHDNYVYEQGTQAYNNQAYNKEKPIALSIDVRLQNILSEEMDKTMSKFKAKGGAGIIVNPKSGEILAMVSKPDFDPHYPGKSSNLALFNMATQGAYEMGSGCKIFPIAIGLDLGIVKMNDAYDLSYLKVGGFQVKDYHKAKNRWSSVGEIFIKSSNVGVAQIMLELGKDNFRNYLKKLRILDKLELEIPECARPLFPNFSNWTDLSLVTMSYGYGISESPAHIIQAMIPIVNGGIFHPLTLMKRSGASNQISERVMKEETSKNMLKMMRLLVKDGTGKKAEVEGYYVGGKTGTADKLVNGKYDKRDKWSAKRMSSFIGVMPSTNPEFLIYITYDEPQGIKETWGFAGGGWTAAETVGKVFSKVVTLYGMPSIDPYSEEVQELNDIEYKITNET